MYTEETRKIFYGQTQVSECASPLKEILIDLLSHPGKFLRGRFLLLCASLRQNRACAKQRIYLLAAGAEVLHLATLIHDDLLDRGELRRGYPTVWKRWGDKPAVLVGDYLFATAYRIFHENVRPGGMALVNNLLKEMVEAQMEEEALRFAPDGLAPYLLRIEKKTARFFQTVCLLGGEAGFLPREVSELCGRFGREFGMAYQILDDITDLVADPRSSGKTCFRDWRNGIATLPLFLLNDREMMKKILRKAAEATELTPEFKLELFPVLTGHNIPGKVWLIYHSYLQNAKKILREIEQALKGEPGVSCSLAALDCLVKKLLIKGRRAINALKEED
ncbi:MAG TPA: polyprenyl synthetase family protein [Bacillota bacterium]